MLLDELDQAHEVDRIEQARIEQAGFARHLDGRAGRDLRDMPHDGLLDGAHVCVPHSFRQHSRRSDARLNPLTATALADEVVLFRRLGEQERIFHYLHTMGGLIASGAVPIRGPLTPDLLRRAFDWLQRQHPVLRAHIRYEGVAFRSVPPFVYPVPFFDTRGTTEIPIRTITDPNPEAWRSILQKETATPIKVGGKHPRIRIALVRTHEGADLHHMILTMDHAIADAQAGSMLSDQLFRYLADPDEMEKQSPTWTGLPPSLETGLPRKSDSGKRTYQPAIRFPKTEVPNPVMASLSVERTIGANVANALRAALRTRRTTMHGAIGAAFLVATRDKFGMDEMTILSTVELRRMMKPPLPVTAFGCYIDILRTHHALTDDFWAMASDLSFKLIGAIARDQESSSILKLADWAVYRHETIPTLTHRRRIDGIAITTAGQSYATTNYGAFKVGGGSGGVSIDMFGPSLFIVSTETDGNLELKVGYPGYVLSTRDAEDLTDRAVAALEEAAQ